MSARDDGGPAFPTQQPALDPRSSGFYNEGGMTLRDYFAAKAMQGLIAGLLADGSKWVDTSPAIVVVSAFEVADAMLAARSA